MEERWVINLFNVYKEKNCKEEHELLALTGIC
jgi:hypothetical protein